MPRDKTLSFLSLIVLFYLRKNPHQGAQNDYTHIFYDLGMSFPITGHLLHRAFWPEFFCVIRRLHKVLSVNVPNRHINEPIIHTHISVTQSNCFRTTCVITSGLIVNLPRMFLPFEHPKTLEKATKETPLKLSKEMQTTKKRRDRESDQTSD